jgi:hypothetical protein
MRSTSAALWSRLMDDASEDALATDSALAPAFDPNLSINAVKYEYDMALATAGSLAGRTTAEDFAMLESFLVHARNLHEFLRPRRPRDIKERENPRSFKHGSVWACDFVKGFGRDMFQTELVESMNRRLQHITTWRQAEHVGWQRGPMLRSLYESMDLFISELESQLVGRLQPTHEDIGRALRAANLLE